MGSVARRTEDEETDRGARGTPPPSAELPPFPEIYDAHVDALWRSARGLGIPEYAVEDVLQDVFLVVHGRLGSFEGRAQLRTWLTKILIRVVGTYRRRHRRKGGLDALPDDVHDDRAPSPDDDVARRQAARVLERFLEG